MSASPKIPAAGISAEAVLEALQLPSRGHVYDLALNIDRSMPQGPRGQFVPYSMVMQATPASTKVETFSYAAELILGTTHSGTHIDGPAHIQSDGRVFGGAGVVDLLGDSGFSDLGMETVPPIISRCVLLDVAALHGVQSLPASYEVSVSDLEESAIRADLEVKAGDVVLVRTGFDEVEQLDNLPYERQPGVGLAAASALADRGIVALGVDTPGIEPTPIADLSQTVHGSLLVERGILLIENLFLADLTRDRVGAALFVCLPLKIVGGTGSWVRPVAIT